MYITTTAADCHGIHKIDVANRDLVQGEDISIIKADNVLEGGCFDEISLTESGDKILIATQRRVQFGDFCE